MVVISFKWNNSHKLVQISVRETNQRDHSIASLVLWSTPYRAPVLMAAVELRANTFVKAWFPKKQQQPQCALWFRVFVKQMFHLSWRNFLFAFANNYSNVTKVCFWLSVLLKFFHFSVITNTASPSWVKTFKLVLFYRKQCNSGVLLITLQFTQRKFKCTFKNASLAILDNHCMYREVLKLVVTCTKWWWTRSSL